MCKSAHGNDKANTWQTGGCSFWWAGPVNTVLVRVDLTKSVGVGQMSYIHMYPAGIVVEVEVDSDARRYTDAKVQTWTHIPVLAVPDAITRVLIGECIPSRRTICHHCNNSRYSDTVEPVRVRGDHDKNYDCSGNRNKVLALAEVP